MNYHELIDDIAKYVTKLFDHFQTPDLVYHNLDHTHKVVERAREIAANYPPEEEFLFVLNAAAWFHDTGHLVGPATGHEEKSVLIMKRYFERTFVEKSTVHLIEQCICATVFPCKPQSLQDEILCDADSYHLGTTEFIITDELVKQEFELRNKFVPSGWNENTLYMLKQHHFFTPYCKLLLEKGKERNIELTYQKLAAAFKRN